MGWIIYVIGCVVSCVLNLLHMRATYWKNSSRDEKFLTLACWIPFMTLLSWVGALLVMFVCVVSFNKLSNEND